MRCSEITEMLPGILNQLGAESLTHLKRLANNVTSSFGTGPTHMDEPMPPDDDDDDDVPGTQRDATLRSSPS